MKRSNARATRASGLLITAFAFSPLHSAAATPDPGQYMCRAGADGNWECGAFEPAPGPVRQPQRPERTVLKRSTGKSVDVPQHLVKEYAEADEPGEQVRDYPRYDWVHAANLPADSKTKVAPHCTGAYVQPSELDPDADPETSPLEASAAQSIEAEGDTAILEGDVYLKQGYRELRADKATINRADRSAVLEGNVSYREPGVLLRGQYAEADMNTGAARLEEGEFLVHGAHARGSAAALERRADEVIEIENGSYTTCPPGTESWVLKTKKIKLNKHTGFGQAEDVTLRLGGVPVFYTPYWFFPLDDRRQSGFLFPAGGYSSENGLEIATPYYLNLAPNYDATIIPRYYSKRGKGLETEFRYLSPKDTGEIAFAYLPGDDEYQGDDRWLYNLKESGVWYDGWRTRVDYSRVSDDQYFEDLGTELNVSSATHLNQLGEVKRSWEWWDLTGRVQGFQTLSDTAMEVEKPYFRLPQLLVQGRVPDRNTGLEYLLTAEYSYFDHGRDSSRLTAAQIAAGAEIKGQRLYVAPGLSYPMHWTSGYVTPTVKLRHAQYFLDDTPTGRDDHESLTVPLFSLDAGLFFERDTRLWDRGYVQTLEPRIYYLWVPLKRQDNIPDFDTDILTFSYAQLFREDRFTGRDRIGDTNHVSVGFTSRLLEDNTGRERLQASLGKIFYFKDRAVNVDGSSRSDVFVDNAKASPLVAEVEMRAGDAWRILSEWQYDDRGERTELWGFGFRYQPDLDHVFNAAYRSRDSIGVEQSDVSFIWPMWGDWSAIGRWSRDWGNERTLENIAGLEYERCCWKMRLVYRHWISDGDTIAAGDDSSNSGVFLQFVMKGLGGVGNQVNTILDDGIPGFRKREDESNDFGGSLLY